MSKNSITFRELLWYLFVVRYNTTANPKASLFRNFLNWYEFETSLKTKALIGIFIVSSIIITATTIPDALPKGPTQVQVGSITLVNTPYRGRGTGDNYWVSINGVLYSCGGLCGDAYRFVDTQVEVHWIATAAPSIDERRRVILFKQGTDEYRPHSYQTRNALKIITLWFAFPIICCCVGLIKFRYWFSAASIVPPRIKSET